MIVSLFLCFVYTYFFYIEFNLYWVNNKLPVLVHVLVLVMLLFVFITVLYYSALEHCCEFYTTQNKSLSILLKEARVCVCVFVCKIGPISARTVSIRLQSARKFCSHSNFPMR